MAKKGKPKKPKIDQGDDPLESLPYRGLLVKISKKAGGEVGGKTYHIPETDLYQYLFTPQNPEGFDSLIDKPLVNVDYAIFAPDFSTNGSTG